MKCPICQSLTSVYRTQESTHHRVLRERRCTSPKCGHRYQTIEILGGVMKENKK
jgi:transcriptional regulator NrdR family protein